MDGGRRERMGPTIGLVAAPRRQRGGVCRARDQYDPSPIFRRARDYCERAFSEWYIISTRHHLLAPHQVIGVGEPGLHRLSPQERQQWVEHVAAALLALHTRGSDSPHFVLYASQRYADLLQRAAPDLDIELPLSGLSLRERLRWYDDRLRTQSRVLRRDEPL